MLSLPSKHLDEDLTSVLRTHRAWPHVQSSWELWCFLIKKHLQIFYWKILSFWESLSSNKQVSKESNNVDWFGFSHQNNCKILKVWPIFKVERVCMAKGSAKYWKSVSIHVKKQQSHRLCWWWHNYNAISRFQREVACAAPLETSHSLVLLSWLGLELWWPREMICVLSLPSPHVALEMSISRP